MLSTGGCQYSNAIDWASVFVQAHVELGLKQSWRNDVIAALRSVRNKFRPIVYATYVPSSYLMQMALVTSMLRFLQAGLTCEELDEVEDSWKVQYSEHGR
jgi:hypothetical protein